MLTDPPKSVSKLESNLHARDKLSSAGPDSGTPTNFPGLQIRT